MPNQSDIGQTSAPTDPTQEAHKRLRKEVLTIFIIAVIILGIIGILYYFELKSGFVTKISEQLVSQFL